MNLINNRILIVDDNPTIREDFRRILSPSDNGRSDLAAIEAELFDEGSNVREVRPDFQLAFAAQGENAAELMATAIDQGRPFAVAIVDIRMPPGIDGVQTVKKLWRMQSDLQVVLCTAYSEYSWEQIVRELGISHRLVVLKKPFDPIEVMQLCHAMTHKWSAEREMALRQLELQSKLVTTSQRVEKVCGELHHERKERMRMESSQSGSVVMDTMSGLASGIAHDFNNALTVIQGHISVALMDPHYSANMEMPLEKVMQATQRASNLSRQLMSLTVEADAATEMSVINITSLIEQQVSMFQRAMKDRIAVEVFYNNEGNFVMAADTQIHRLVNALCIRSRELMAHGGRINITISTQTIVTQADASALHEGAGPGDYCVLYFEDNSLACKNGEGGEQEIIQENASSSMLLARSLAQKLGGWITSQVIDGVGCRNSVYLSAANPQSAEMPRPSMTKASENSLVVMVVDDEPSVCDIIAYVLSRQGHQVIKANQALEAWTAWQKREQKIDLLIADIYLPDGITGFELARHMRASAPNLPVIYMSGYHPDLFLTEETLIMGHNYLSKPFDVLDLLNAAGRALESSTVTTPTSRQPSLQKATAMQSR